MRRRIAASRARVRTAARIVIAVTISLIVGLLAFSRVFLAPYGTAAGQFMLILIGACFGAAFWWLDKIARSVRTPASSPALMPCPARPGRRPAVIGALLLGGGLGAGLLAIAAGLAPVAPPWPRHSPP